jgi:hypothetical protein
LDPSDEYVMTELEDDNDQNDASYLERGPQEGLGLSHEDDEPSLGSSGHGEGGPIIYLAHAISDSCHMIYDCKADEHDGREPDDEGSAA